MEGKDEEMDVVIPTLNSMTPCLEECLESLDQEHEIHTLIIIDGYSDDGTVEYIESFCDNRGIELDLTQTEAPLSKCCEMGMKKVETEWFQFIGSDVILKEGFVEEFKNTKHDRLGAFQGRNTSTREDQNTTHLFKKIWGGSTEATVIRTELVQDISIPEDLVVREDEYIRRHIENNKGMKWHFSYRAWYDHLGGNHPPSFNRGRLQARYGFNPGINKDLPWLSALVMQGRKHPRFALEAIGFFWEKATNVVRRR